MSRSAPALEFTLRGSRAGVATLVAATTLATVAPWHSALGPVVCALLSAAALMAGAHALRQFRAQANLRCIRHADGTWTLLPGALAGRDTFRRELHSHVVLGPLVALCFEPAEGALPRTNLLIVADAIDPEPLRRLRVVLRHLQAETRNSAGF